MNIKRNLLGASALLLSALAMSANAATISLSPTSGSVLPGESFSVEIFGDFDDVGGLAGGGVDFFWDPALVGLDNVTLDLPGADASFSCPGAVGCPPDTANSTRVSWGGFAALIAPGAGSTLMATLDFTAGAGAGLAAFNLADSGDGWINAAFSPFTTPGFLGTSVTVAAVPVPAAVWLFGSGLLGLVGVARRRKVA